MIMNNHTKQEGDYIVFFPEDIDLPNYEGVRIAETHAKSERQAVSKILFRKNNGLNNRGARIAMGLLDKKFGGVEKYATLVPKTDGYDLIDYVVANELAVKNGSNDISKYVQKARFLLKGVGRLN